MCHPDYGLEVRDRRYRFIKYKDCFIGSQAVEWLCNGVPDLKRDRKKALTLGRSLLKEGFINHVLNAHDFKDKFLFYKFNADLKKWWTIDLEGKLVDFSIHSTQLNTHCETNLFFFFLFPFSFSTQLDCSHGGKNVQRFSIHWWK